MVDWPETSGEIRGAPERTRAHAAVVDGGDVRSCGHTGGLAEYALSASLGPLGEQVWILTWLRDDRET
ncbi:hypothetical protein [Amycolatopsis sp. cmx-4-54]|uniref:hypothetical protein n=1 Tax=Amycolatopsis sp. cmx-4-54 TaxID=2790936 RepID=UPI0039790480